MNLKKIWIKASRKTKIALILACVCCIASIVNFFIHSDTMMQIIDKGLLFALMCDFFAMVEVESKTEKELAISEERRRKLIFLYRGIQVRLLNGTPSWTSDEIYQLFIEQEKKYLEEIKEK